MLTKIQSSEAFKNLDSTVDNCFNFWLNVQNLQKSFCTCKEIYKINVWKCFYLYSSLTQLPVRLGSELPNEGFALIRNKLEVSSSLPDGKPMLSLLLDLASALNSSQNLERFSLKFRGREAKTSELNSALLSSSESDYNKGK